MTSLMSVYCKRKINTRASRGAGGYSAGGVGGGGGLVSGGYVSAFTFARSLGSQHNENTSSVSEALGVAKRIGVGVP